METLIAQLPWDLLLATALSIAVGWYLRDAVTRSNERETLEDWRPRLEQATRQAQEVARTLRSEMAYQQKALRMVETALNESRRNQQASQGELSESQALVRQLRSHFEALQETAEDPEASRTEVEVAERAAAGRVTSDSHAQDLRKLADELATARRQLRASRRQVDEADDRNRTLERELEDAVRGRVEAGKALEIVKQELVANRDAMRRAQHEATAPRPADGFLMESLKADLEACHAALLKCDRELAVKTARIEELETEGVPAGSGSAASVPAPERQLELETHYLTLLAEKDQRVADLEAELNQLAVAAVPAPATPGAGDPGARDRGVRDSGTRESRGEAPAAEAASTAKDDLTRIRGIGPALERRLNGIGVTTLRQIAQWDDAEIERVAGHLGRFGKRIDRWVEAARGAVEEERWKS